MQSITTAPPSPRWEVVCGDALQTLRRLPDGSVHCCVTSPPYYGLRDYGTEGQVGLESSPAQYVTRLVEIFHEVRRVLRDDGTCWLNLGDSYSNIGKWGGSSSGKHATTLHTGHQTSSRAHGGSIEGLKPKDLIGIPWMVAFALREDGWYLRSDIIWQKPNVMPQSVTDRPTSSHEYIFLLTKSPRYFYDDVAVREPSAEPDRGPRRDRFGGNKHNGETTKHSDGSIWTGDAQTRNRRSVWTIASKPFKEAHFATFPPALVEPCVMAGTSERGVCSACSAPWVHIVERKAMVVEPSARREEAHANGAGSGRTVISGTMVSPATTTIGWRPTCECAGAAISPAMVLDPFSGAGTTGLVATGLGRGYLGIELNEAYCEMSRRRIAEGVGSTQTEGTIPMDARLEHPPVLLTNHPILKHIIPYAASRPLPDFVYLPKQLRDLALGIMTNCPACGAAVHPFVPTTVEQCLAYALACPDCAETEEAMEHVEQVRQQLERRAA